MAAVMGMIFYLSHQPGDAIQLPRLVGIDKLLHAAAYGVLALSFIYGLHPFTHPSNRIVSAAVVILFCLLFGISDEFHQSFIPGRFVSLWDVIADSFGALLAVAYWYKHIAGNGAEECS